MYTLKYSQKLPISLSDSWAFFSSPKNLKLITPASMGFKILNDVADNMYAGQLISYSICLIPRVPFRWVTEITHVEQEKYFVDEQRIGPFRLWHHEHRFKSIPGGTEMEDIVYYVPPLGPIGTLLNRLKIQKDVEKIFIYRRDVLEKRFGTFQPRDGC